MAIFAIIGFCLFPMPWIANFDPIVTFLVGLSMVIIGTFQFLIFLDKARQMDKLNEKRAQLQQVKQFWQQKILSYNFQLVEWSQFKLPQLC